MKKIFLALMALVAGGLASNADTLKLDFSGSDNLYGMTRQKVRAATFQTDLKISEEGVDFTFSTNSGNGFALADISATTSEQKKQLNGLMLAKTAQVKVDIEVPDGKITSVKIVEANSSGGSYVIPFTEYNDAEGTTTDLESVVDDNTAKLYSWTWTNNDYTGSKVSFIVKGNSFDMMDTFMFFVKSIQVTYTADLGGKLPADLTFAQVNAEGVVGETFTAPELSNPNNLPIVWSSSNENIATVDAQGNVTLLAYGDVTIKASTEGNDSYAKGSAQYEIKSIGVANNIPALVLNAPDRDMQVKVNFPMTVTFAKDSKAFVIDAEGNATAIYNTKNDESTSQTPETIYKVGDIIPAGWMATNLLYAESCWKGLPEDATETVEVVYPIVESINYAEDANKVVVLKNVTFATSTDYTDIVVGTTPTASYNFQNTYELADNPAGTYDVTLVVNYARNGTIKWLAPIKFEVPAASEIVLPAAKDLVVAISGEGSIAYDEDMEAFMGTTTVTEDNAVVTFTVPEGFDNFISMDMTPSVGSNVATQAEDEEDAWVPVENLTEAGFVLGNAINVPADGAFHMYGLYLVKDGKANQEGGYMMSVSATKKAAELEDKTVTIDFTQDSYGISSTTIAANSTFVKYEHVILTNDNKSKTFRSKTGFNMTQFSTFTVSSTEGPVKSVTIESQTTSDPEDFYITYNDGVATVRSDYLGSAVINKITVVFEADGLEDAGIKFPAATLQLINGKEEIKGLVLENPNNLPVTYSSSDAKVSVNENGEISIAEDVVGATATITATFAGNDTYRKEDVSYNLTIVGVAKSITEMMSLTKASNDKAYVDFPMVVAFSSGSYVYVQSLDGKESAYINQLSGAKNYPTGSIIPQGWVATATISYNYPYYKMSETPETVQTQEPVIERVTSISTDNVYQVVILPKVIIGEDFDMKEASIASFTLPYGDETLNGYNAFKIDKPEPGTYDLKCVVTPFSLDRLRVYPIEFTEPAEDPKPEEPKQGEVTFDFMADDYGFGRDATTYIPTGTVIKEDNASITLTKGASSNGFRMWTDGLRVYKNAGNTMTFKVEGAQINKITINSDKTQGTPKFNNEEVSYASKQYVWTGDAETVDAVFSTTANNAIQSIVIEYTILAPGKDSAELSFSASAYTAGDNEKFFNGATLVNPNNVAVTWTSSDESVATVTEEGAVAIVGCGTTTITASSEETDKFAAGKASYELTIVPAANTVAQMIEKAPKEGDQVLMSGSLYVAYANGKNVYVYDMFDQATLLFDTNNYVTGDLIPGGWVATNADYNGLLEWTGTFPASTQNFADFIEYPTVESITTADVSRVVTVPNVEFADKTPASQVTVQITLPDGSKVDLYNKFKIEQQEAGKYDVVVAVGLFNGKLQLYPIEYKEPAKELTYPSSLEITTNSENVEIEQKTAGDGSLQINITGKVSDDNFTATLKVPEGWTNFLISEEEGVTISDGNISIHRAASEAYWVPVDQLTSMGYALGNTITVPADNIKNNLTVMLVNEDKADYANTIELNIKVAKDLTGVDAIEAAEDGAKYFTLDGVEVKNPAKGIYIKVLNGEASKVVRK